jgi:hypothetical protein
MTFHKTVHLQILGLKINPNALVRLCRLTADIAHAQGTKVCLGLDVEWLAIQ